MSAVITLVVSPAALAQDVTDLPTTTTTTDSPTPTTTTTTSPTSETSTSPVVTTSETPPPPGTTAGEAAKGRKANPTTPKSTPTSTPASTPEPPPEKPYTDNVGHGFIGLSGDGVLVIACKSGAPSGLSTANLTVRGGPDQDEADGRYWNYDVSVVSEAPGEDGHFSWTCAGQAGEGDIEFEQLPPEPGTPTPTPSTPSTPSTTATPVPATTSSPSVATKPKAQVRYAPKGGIETGSGGLA